MGSCKPLVLPGIQKQKDSRNNDCRSAYPGKLNINRSFSIQKLNRMKTFNIYLIIMVLLVSCSKENLEPQYELQTPYLVTTQSGVMDSLDYYYDALQHALLETQTMTLSNENPYETIANFCTDTFGEHPWQVPSTVPIDSTEIWFNELVDNSQLSSPGRRRIRIMAETLLIPEDPNQLSEVYNDFRAEITNDTLLSPEDKRVLLGTLWFMAEISQETPVVGILSEEEEGGGRKDEDWDISIGHVYNWLEGDLQSNAEGIHNALILSVDSIE